MHSYYFLYLTVVTRPSFHFFMFEIHKQLMISSNSFLIAPLIFPQQNSIFCTSVLNIVSLWNWQFNLISFFSPRTPCSPVLWIYWGLPSLNALFLFCPHSYPKDHELHHELHSLTRYFQLRWFLTISCFLSHFHCIDVSNFYI